MSYGKHGETIKKGKGIGPHEIASKIGGECDGKSCVTCGRPFDGGGEQTRKALVDMTSLLRGLLLWAAPRGLTGAEDAEIVLAQADAALARRDA